jgi:hypothetical protein
MYRIRFPSGDEVTYPTLEAFTAGVRAGVVTPDSEIHHARADRWIPVNMHPHYKLALDANGNGNGSSARTSENRANAAPVSTARPTTGPVPAVQTPTHKGPTTGPIRAIQTAQSPTPTTGPLRAIRLPT